MPNVVGLPESFSGWSAAVTGKPLRGTPEADFMAIMDQIGGKTFLQAYETLKGGGVITEIEGEKATKALARMSTAQTEKAFVEAVDEFKSVIQTGLDRVKQRAGGKATVQSSDDDLIKKYLGGK